MAQKVYGFSAKDWYALLVPEAGPNKGDELRLKTWNKCEVDPGPKATSVKGHRIKPTFIAVGAAEPKISFDGMLSDEGRAVRKHVGGIGGYPFTVILVAHRPGTAVRKYEAKRCTISGGLGISIDEGSGSTTKLEALPEDIHEDGESIYTETHPA